MPVPPARSLSTSVPCGVSSTSSSPDRYSRATSLLPPTNELIVLQMRPAYSSMPKAWSSTPQLFEIVVRSRVPCSRSASISAKGTPQSPKPPTASTAPSGTSATACAALTITLSIDGLLLASGGRRRRQQGVRSRSRGRHLLVLGGDRRVTSPGGVQQGRDAVAGDRPGVRVGVGDGEVGDTRDVLFLHAELGQ